MKIATTLVLCLLGGPALADCDRWTATMEEDEGGPRMAARICAGADGATAEFIVQCGARGELSMRYLPPAPADSQAGDEMNVRTELKISFDGTVFTRPAHYEAMDGALVLQAAIGTPLLQSMMSERHFTLTSADERLPGSTFTLANSRQAIGKVIRSCEP